ncbi:MAG: glycerophosphodiester phosphodiesterase [Candidatus Sulfotelmatobacter sp.]
MPTRPLLLGHRGSRGETSIPENTLASFDRTLAHGCDGFEFDVRRSADGQPVICHDAMIHSVRIAETSSAKLALPKLEDVLKRYQETAFLDIELKEEGLETITRDLLRSDLLARGYVVSSFLPGVLQAVHDLDASIPLGLICETRKQLDLWSELPLQYVIPHHKLVRQKLIRDMHDAGRRVLAWTVNSPQDIHRFADWGVDGIVSDYPQRLVHVLGRELNLGIHE